MICVYPADCTDFSTNGNGTLVPLSAEVTETLNGEYELTLVHSMLVKHRNKLEAALPLAWLLCSPRFRLASSRAADALAPSSPPQEPSESTMDERSSYNCALRKLRGFSQSIPWLWFPRPRQQLSVWFPAGFPEAFSHRACL